MGRIKVVNNQEIPLSEAEEISRDKEEAKAKKDSEDYVKIKYKDDRRTEFDVKFPIGDQLDYIFHNGLAKWKTDIVQPVKDKFPKP